MNKEILNINDNGQYHGYQEWYNANNELWHKGNFKNGNRIGYCEQYMAKQTLFYIR